MKIGIIGGTGKMGQFFVPVFERAGYDVRVSGRKTALTNEELAATSDIVIVSVPIHDTCRVIGEIAPLMQKDQLLCDLTSLKVRPVGAMLASKADVIGLHPMFGPTVGSLKSQTIIVCPARADEYHTEALLKIFRNEGATCTITTPEEHDRMVAIVQGLTHFVTLCMADTVRRLGIDIRATQEFTSPVYQIELSLMGRLLSQDPLLYADILQQNPYVPAVLAACRGSASDLSSVVTGHDPELFKLFFERNSRHLGSYCEEGQKMTDALIECMVNK
ncbi:MAG: prephenate dehydrogenase/arogenate dehydrogenase family protein [Methanoregula sp.]|jgi:prephenate dehydrogenase|uniref:prephenate dehydrogenase/arogenate dehydrogenase family protein n=1 Tax=Methanoregula sp. TaxID=2052170 RepID=UPI0025E4B991|nr:prephenate dehydrogenase/arogenate dehydrogenase family protein [Methanoregula sp.]MCK9632702.1 prephenate dehydrogenase/arogenate dehydrogenase family protein [Methanoregula sp.]